jgi:hypothetical protein
MVYQKQRQANENFHAFMLTSSVLQSWGTFLKNPFNSKTMMQEVKTSWEKLVKGN